jgi:hypothetical protein
VSDSLRFAFCGLCRRLFFACRRCDRGQRYCGEVCADEARQRSLRAARLRHQRSPEGRLDHCDRQRAYRERRVLRVMDTRSEMLAQSATVRGRADDLAPSESSDSGPQETIDARAFDDGPRFEAVDAVVAQERPRRAEVESAAIGSGLGARLRSEGPYCRFCGARGRLVRAGFVRRPRARTAARAPP